MLDSKVAEFHAASDGVYDAPQILAGMLVLDKVAKNIIRGEHRIRSQGDRKLHQAIFARKLGHHWRIRA